MSQVIASKFNQFFIDNIHESKGCYWFVPLVLKFSHTSQSSGGLSNWLQIPGPNPRIFDSVAQRRVLVMFTSNKIPDDSGTAALGPYSEDQ